MNVSKGLGIIFFLILLFPSFSRSEPMKFAYFDNYPPRSYRTEGKMTGIIIDIIDIVVKDRMGIDVIHEGFPWARAQVMVKNGEFDAFVTVPTPERRTYTFISREPLFKFETFIAAPADHNKLYELKQVTSVDGLKDFKLVDYLGNGWAKKALKELNVYWLPNYEAIFTFLLQGKADAVIVSEVGINTIKNCGYQDSVVVLPHPISSIGFYLCVGKRSAYKEILKDFDSEIKKAKDEGIIKKIIDSYYN
ncbi:MAG: transporter substrate-binding domain-containing protein [Desulfobacter sp.]|nr:MAG: transporter substrate-binding domain-containing protein [Desulfobacter sp.]